MITPDTKDWTWVLQRPCDECGFDAGKLAVEQVPEAVAANAAAWAAVLARPAAELRLRPRPQVWSPLEYACHVRDVYGLFEERLRVMLAEDGPRFRSWDQDEAAVAEGYNEQEPAAVLGELTTAAGRVAAGFERVSGDQWHRTGTRADGARFTVASLSRYLLHDVGHHVYDATEGARSQGGEK